MSFKKTLCSILAGAMLAGSLSSCTLRSPTMPQQRTVTANATMFANTGVSYILSSPDGTDIEWKRPCDTGYTKGAIVPMLNGCYGMLEVRVNGGEANKLTIFKGEDVTDAELQAYLATLIGTGPNKLDAWGQNVGIGGGYTADAQCHRQAMGSGTNQTFFVLYVSNNTEMDQGQAMKIYLASGGFDLLIIDQTDSSKDTLTEVVLPYLNNF